jgi:hypothetical protein
VSDDVAPPVFVTSPPAARPRHTPGPWSYELDVVDDGDINVFGPAAVNGPIPGTPICSVDVRDDPDDDMSPPREVALANACLISAATELLEAARELADTLHDCETSSECAVLIARGEAVSCARIRRARAAIAKAEGRA